MPYPLGRLARNYELNPAAMADPREGFRRLYFDSLVYDPAPLEVVHKADFSEATIDAILSGNACRVFRLSLSSRILAR